MDKQSRLIEELCNVLNSAHDEVLRAQGCKPEDFAKYDWPEWSPQSNSIRWAEKILDKPLSKTAIRRIGIDNHDD